MDWPNKPASIDLAVIFEFCDKNVSKCLKHGGLQIISSLFNVYPKSIQCLNIFRFHMDIIGWPLPSQNSRASSRLLFRFTLEDPAVPGK